MAGRAATPVKSTTKPKPRLSAKPTAHITPVKTKPVLADGEEAPVKPRRRAKVETRTRIYWAVFNQDCKRIAVFEFDQKIEAEKRACKMIKNSGEHHFIQKIKATVPV